MTQEYRYTDPETGALEILNLEGWALEIRQGDMLFSHVPLPVLFNQALASLIVGDRHEIIAHHCAQGQEPYEFLFVKD